MLPSRKIMAALGGEALVLTTAQVSALLVGFVGTVLVTRALGPEARGAYAWLLTLQGMSAQVATLVTYGAVRKLAAEHPLSQSGPLAGTIIALSLIGSLLTFPALIYGWFDPHVGLQHHKALLICFAILPLAAVVNGLSALVHIRHNPLHTLTNLVAPRLAMLASTLLFLASGSLALGSAVWASQVPTLLGLGLTLTFLPVPWHTCRPSLTLARRIIGFLGASWLGGLTLFALPKLALLRMGQLSTLTETGYYSIATTLMEVALIIPFSMGHVLTSHISRGKHSTGEAPAHSVWKHTLLMAGGMAALCLVGGLLAGWLLPFIFGPKFAFSVAPFRWLLPSVVLATVHQGLNSHILSHGPKTAIWIPSTLACLATLAASEALIPTSGAIGATWATAIGYITLITTTLAIMAYRTSK